MMTMMTMMMMMLVIVMMMMMIERNVSFLFLSCDTSVPTTLGYWLQSCA